MKTRSRRSDRLSVDLPDVCRLLESGRSISDEEFLSVAHRSREDRMPRLACRISAIAVAMYCSSCIAAAAQEYSGREKLRAQSNEFRKEVIRVTDGVYVAVGYSASNVILIRGDSGSIVVDT